MNPGLSLIREGKKYLWDGRSYATAEDAATVMATYANDQLAALLLEQDGAFLVYTRRVVKETALPTQ